MAPSARLGFNGVVHEPRTRWQLLGNGYRAYNPVLMRFHSPDSMSPSGRGGINAYAYCGNDGINCVDPSGHFVQYLPTMVLGLGAAGAIVGAVVADDTPAKVGSAAAAAALLISAVGVFSMTQPTVRKWMSGGFTRPPPPRPRAPSESASVAVERMLATQREKMGHDVTDMYNHFTLMHDIAEMARQQSAVVPVRLPSSNLSRSSSGVPGANTQPLPHLMPVHAASTNARPVNVTAPQADSSTTSLNLSIRRRAVSIDGNTLSLQDM